MTLHLRPETQAKLEAHATALGVSVDEYLEALVEKEPPPEADAPACSGGQFQKEQGLWVYRTGDPMPASLVDDTLDAIRREREIKFLGNIPG